MSLFDRWWEIGNYGEGIEAYVYWTQEFEDKFAEAWNGFWNLAFWFGITGHTHQWRLRDYDFRDLKATSATYRCDGCFETHTLKGRLC